ncbi:MAG: tetratricopeptide repeat protein, partial [Bdellovibrionota bacterium]
MTQGRQTLHRSGFEALKRGDYAEAVKILENCVRVHGPHVAPLTDLALAAYLKEDMGRFGQAVEQLEKAVAEAEPALSAENRVRAHVALAKCFELQGRIAEAFDR